jgi:hypothetical protein
MFAALKGEVGTSAEDIVIQLSQESDALGDGVGGRSGI